jgi:hypothetical protein
VFLGTGCVPILRLQNAVKSYTNGPVHCFEPPAPRVEDYYFYHKMMGKAHKINYSKVT